MRIQESALDYMVELGYQGTVWHLRICKCLDPDRKVLQALATTSGNHFPTRSKFMNIAMWIEHQFPLASSATVVTLFHRQANAQFCIAARGNCCIFQ